MRIRIRAACTKIGGSLPPHVGFIPDGSGRYEKIGLQIVSLRGYSRCAIRVPRVTKFVANEMAGCE